MSPVARLTRRPSGLAIKRQGSDVLALKHNVCRTLIREIRSFPVPVAKVSTAGRSYMPSRPPASKHCQSISISIVDNGFMRARFSIHHSSNVILVTLQLSGDHCIAWHAVTASLGRSNRFGCIQYCCRVENRKIKRFMPPCYRVQLITMLSAIKFGYSSISDETLCSTRNTKVPFYQNIKYF